MDSGYINFKDRKPVNKPDFKESIIDTSFDHNKEVFEELNEGNVKLYPLPFRVAIWISIAACSFIFYKWIINMFL